MQYCAAQLDYVGGLQVVPPSCVPCYNNVGLALLTAQRTALSLWTAPATSNPPAKLIPYCTRKRGRKLNGDTSPHSPQVGS